MKIWVGHGSEHSYRLVLIGTFADVNAATVAKDHIDQLRQAAANLPPTDWERTDERMPDELHGLLMRLRHYNLSRAELEGLNYLESVERVAASIRVETDDAEIQGLIKLLVDGGARLEIHSRSRWTDTGEPVGEEAESPEASDAATDGESGVG